MRLTEHQQWKVSKALDAPEYFDALETAEEFHVLADHWNWDYGLEELRQILDHPLCDRATALLIYWRGGAGYQRQYATRADASDRYLYDLVDQAKSALEVNQFLTERFNYDPTFELNQYDDVEKKWDHPESAKRPVVGEVIESDVDSWFVFTIIDGLVEGLTSQLSSLQIQPMTHDCEGETVWFLSGKGDTQLQADFSQFRWRRSADHTEIEFGLAFDITFGSYPQFASFCTRYNAKADKLESAITKILESWSQDFLEILKVVSSEDQFQAVAIDGQTIHGAGFSFETQSKVSSAQLSDYAQQLLRCQSSLPMIVETDVEGKARAYIDSTGNPQALSADIVMGKNLWLVFV